MLECIYGRKVVAVCIPEYYSKVLLFDFGPLNYNIASGFTFIAVIIDYALHGPYACLRKYKKMHWISKIII